VTDPVGEWTSASHARGYLAKADSIPHRHGGEAAFLEHLDTPLGRVLDIGTGDGRLLDLVRATHPGVGGVAVDYSPEMLTAARERFGAAPEVEVVDHDINDALPDLGAFDAVVSSFANHHCPDDRKAGPVRRGLRRPLAGGVPPEPGARLFAECSPPRRVPHGDRLLT